MKEKGGIFLFSICIDHFRFSFRHTVCGSMTKLGSVPDLWKAGPAYEVAAFFNGLKIGSTEGALSTTYYYL